MTDVIHFFVLVGALLAVPFVLHNVGGESVVAKLPPEQPGFTKVGWKPSSALLSCTS